MKALLTTGMILTLAILATPALAQQGPSPDDPEHLYHPEAAQELIVRFLDLTEDQVAAWNALIEARNAAAQPLREAIAAIDAELEVLLSGDDPDPYVVGDLVIDRRELYEQLADVHRTYVEDFADLLDEEQLEKYGFVRQAERVQPIIPAFRVVGLLPPHWR